MGYGITAYRTKKIFITDKIWASNNPLIAKDILIKNRLGMLKEELFKGKKCITPKKALDEIVSGNITATNGTSGAVYRYVLEIILKSGFRKDKEEINKLKAESTHQFKVVNTSNKFVHKLANDKFYPIDFDTVKNILLDYEDFGLPIPHQDDFPVVSIIPLNELRKLFADCTSLNLPDDCTEQFQGWVKECVLNHDDLLLFYC